MADATPTPATTVATVVADVKADAVAVVSFGAKVKAFCLKYGITAAGVGVGFALGKIL